MLEALLAARWIAALLPSLPLRGIVTVLLVTARGVTGSVQLLSAVALRWNRPFAPVLAAFALAASAVLVIFETGLRLTPSNVDPTFRWWFVAGYALYAAVASWAITRTNP